MDSKSHETLILQQKLPRSHLWIMYIEDVSSLDLEIDIGPSRHHAKYFSIWTRCDPSGLALKIGRFVWNNIKLLQMQSKLSQKTVGPGFLQ
jgi:hypothetical protein